MIVSASYLSWCKRPLGCLYTWSARPQSWPLWRHTCPPLPGDLGLVSPARHSDRYQWVLTGSIYYLWDGSHHCAPTAKLRTACLLVWSVADHSSGFTANSNYFAREPDFSTEATIPWIILLSGWKSFGSLHSSFEIWAKVYTSRLKRRNCHFISLNHPI